MNIVFVIESALTRGLFWFIIVLETLFHKGAVVPERSDADFQEGEICIYNEDGARFKCKIIKRFLREGMLYLTLKILEVIQPHVIFSTFNEVGREFTVDKDPTVKYYPGLWYLEEITPASMSDLN